MSRSFETHARSRARLKKRGVAGDISTVVRVQIPPPVHYVKASVFLAASSSRYIPIRRLEVSSILNIKTIIFPEERTDWKNNCG